MPNTSCYISVEIDPTVSLAQKFDALKKWVTEHKEVNGLSIEVLPGTNTAFWQKLTVELETLTSSVDLQQFKLKTAIADEEQDFSALLTLPFWNNLTMLCLDAKMEVGCLQVVINRLGQQTQLTTLALNSTDLTAEEANLIVRKKIPPSLNSLDMCWNPIEVADNKDAFNQFCKSVQDSPLQKLFLSSIGSNECMSLMRTLVTLKRQFNLTLFASPHLKDEDLSLLIQAMNLNHHLTIPLDDTLGFIQDAAKIATLKAQCNENQTPSLQRLTAFYLASELEAGRLQADEVAALPEPIIRMLPLTDEAKKTALLLQHEANWRAAITATTVSALNADDEETNELIEKTQKLVFFSSSSK